MEEVKISSDEINDIMEDRGYAKFINFDKKNE